MTNTKKCKCTKLHTLTDILTTEDNLKVVNVQKWHKCFHCGKFQLSKWISLHELRCDTKWANHLA